MSTPELFVVGRFPPPLDGQSIATERLATLLEPDFGVERIDLNPGGEAFVQSRVRFRTSAARHFLRTRRRLRTALSRSAQSPVLWTTISPTPLGHLRDILTVAPAFQRGQRVLGVVHHGDFDRVFRSLSTRYTARRLVAQLDGVVFLSYALAERCAPWIPEAKRLVAPNTIDEALICSAEELSAKRACRASQRPTRLLFFSHMIPSKGYMDVVMAMSVLRARGIAVEADFVGRWDSAEGQQAFEQAVHEHEVDEHITHHGGVYDRARAKALYLSADIFLLPTYYPTEAQPLTVIEALNAGTPVIVTDHASLPETVREGQEGHLVPPRDPEAIADAVEKLCDRDHWERSSVRARERFEDVFSPEAVRHRWKTLLGTAP